MFVFVCREQIEVCVEILGHVLQTLEPVQLAQNYKTALHSGLNHPDDSVKILTLTQVSRSLSLFFPLSPSSSISLLCIVHRSAVLLVMRTERLRC